MGKSQPLDKPVHLPHGIASIAGVFFTAFILFLLSIHYPNSIANNTHAYGVFTAVCAIYFLDHYLDFKLIFGGFNFYTQLNKILAMLFVVITTIIVLCFWKIYLLNLNYYFAAVGVLLYALFYVVKKSPFRYVKEMTIAATSAWVVCIKPDVAFEYYSAIVLASLFFQNVLMYSYFERELDEYFGFRSSFNAAFYSSKKHTLVTVQLITLIAILIVSYFYDLPNGLTYVSIAYFMLSLCAEKRVLKKYYRFLLDALLLGVLIP